jgi:hypothetical protein
MLPEMLLVMDQGIPQCLHKILGLESLLAQPADLLAQTAATCSTRQSISSTSLAHGTYQTKDDRNHRHGLG